jgi:hypothetical protein
LDLICPNCRGELQMTAPGWAVCAQHGGRYEVLFARSPAFAPAPVAPTLPAQGEPVALVNCAQHPARAAVAACRSCGTQLCTTCSFDVRGVTYCGDCGIEQAKNPAPVAPRPQAPMASYSAGGVLSLNLSAPPATGWTDNVKGKCQEHPDVDAVASCRLCSNYVCATCDFELPGGVHLCPVCVENQSSEDVSPKRKRLSYIALALATWSTILFVMMFAGAFNSWFQDPETGKLADLFITNITLWPLLVGTGVSLSALDSKLKNTGLMKAAAWWNGILGGIFLLIVIAANLGLIG